MAAGQSNYNRGEMPVKEQEGTFKGFMAMTMYGGAAVVVILLFPTLIFGTSIGWLASLIVSVIVGIVIGLALKLKGVWYASLIFGAILTALSFVIFPAIFSLFF